MEHFAWKSFCHKIEQSLFNQFNLALLIHQGVSCFSIITYIFIDPGCILFLHYTRNLDGRILFKLVRPMGFNFKQESKIPRFKSTIQQLKIEKVGYHLSLFQRCLASLHLKENVSGEISDDNLIWPQQEVPHASSPLGSTRCKRTHGRGGNMIGCLPLISLSVYLCHSYLYLCHSYLFIT